MKKFKELGVAGLEVITGGGAPLFYGANGYLSRGKNGKYHYTVTKGPFDAVTGIIANGWVQSAGSGFGFPR
jgi:hypothetical protein